MLVFTVYTRPNCHLCEQLVADLNQVLTSKNVQAELEWVDIEADLALLQQHGQRVPVLTLAGKEICFGRLDVSALDTALLDIAFSQAG